jgi:hypothetical protein
MHSNLVDLFDQPRFAAALKSRRGARSLRELAREIPGVTYRTLARLETDENPSFEAYLRICRWARWPVRLFIKSTRNYSP